MDRQVLSDDDVARVRVTDTWRKGEQTERTLVENDGKGNPRLLDEVGQLTRVFTAVQPIYQNPLVLVRLPNSRFEVWQLQTTDRSEQGEVGEHCHLTTQGVELSCSGEIEEAEVSATIVEIVADVELGVLSGDEMEFERAVARVRIVGGEDQATGDAGETGARRQVGHLNHVGGSRGDGHRRFFDSEQIWIDGDDVGDCQVEDTPVAHDDRVCARLA